MRGTLRVPTAPGPAAPLAERVLRPGHATCISTQTSGHPCLRGRNMITEWCSPSTSAGGRHGQKMIPQTTGHWALCPPHCRPSWPEPPRGLSCGPGLLSVPNTLHRPIVPGYYPSCCAEIVLICVDNTDTFQQARSSAPTGPHT